MKSISKLKGLTALCIMLALICSEAYAQGGGPGRGKPGRVEEPRGRGEWHHYRDGRWYRGGLFWVDTAVSVLAIGALIDRLPPRYTTVVYAGVPYYYSEGYYYRPYDRGYVVVQSPIMAQTVMTQPLVVTQQIPAPTITSVVPTLPSQGAQSPDTMIINIPNSKGGYTPVALKKAGTGYIGPQGEYYSDNPTVEQLKILYGGN